MCFGILSIYFFIYISADRRSEIELLFIFINDNTDAIGTEIYIHISTIPRHLRRSEMFSIMRTDLVKGSCEFVKSIWEKKFFSNSIVDFSPREIQWKYA